MGFGAIGSTNFSTSGEGTRSEASVTGMQSAGGAELELWAGPPVGMLIDGYLASAHVRGNANQFTGKQIVQAHESALVGIRPWGNGDPMASEIAWFIGPSIENYSSVQSYPNKTFYDLRRMNVLGGRFHMRFRIGIFERYAIECAGHYFLPLDALGAGDEKLQKSGTRAYGGRITFEKELLEGINLGTGFRHDAHQLASTPAGSAKTQTVIFNMSAWFAFVRFHL